MGYFELEQRVPEDGIRFGAACALEPGITLNVYGDVWRWLSDEKVCLLKEKVFQVQFLYVHVDSVARKAAAIAQVGNDGNGQAHNRIGKIWLNGD